MATKWTDAQKAAIETRDKTLLVSAAAGSGKTATLTERIIRSITDADSPSDISRMLIVTYTKASAADLKAKISKALSLNIASDPTNSHLTSQLIALGSAHISTIDSFYYDIVRAHFQNISLPQVPRITEETELIPLSHSVMNEAIEDMYTASDGFERFMEHFTSARDNDSAAEIFIDMYDKLLSQRDGIEVLKKYAEELSDAAGKSIFETKYGETALAQTTAFIKYALAFTQDAYEQIQKDKKVDEKYGDAFSDDLAFFTELNALIDQRGYAEIAEKLTTHMTITPQTLRGYPEFSNIRAVRKSNYEDLEKIKKDYFRFSDAEIEKSFRENSEICLELYALLKEFDKRFMSEKASRGICSFADIRRFVLEILCNENGEPTSTALEYRDRFDYIYIDEYQDVDEVQDTIFKTIARKNNRFMVGDIKQSIYGFRNADPTIFASYKDRLPKLGTAESEECAIFMSNNFRCDKTVVDFSNAVSSFLFSNRAKSIGYTSDDDLVFSKSNEDAQYKPTPVVVATTGVLPDNVKNTQLDAEQKEFAKTSAERYVAGEILNLIRYHFCGDRAMRFGDIAVLVRKKTSIPALLKEFEKCGIPATAPKSSDFFENPDVLLVMSLLSTIDNPQKDIPLAGTLRSPFFGFSMEDIMTVRLGLETEYSLYDALVSYSENENELGTRCKSFIDKLNYWREAAVSTPCDKLIKRLYNELSILSFGKVGSKNLLRLYEYAIKFESGGFKGLYGFIKYVEDLIENGIKLPESEESGNDNSVKIMSIHSSKGLEFPVCFIFDCQKAFSTTSAKKPIQFDPHVGIGFVPHDESGMAKYDSPLLRSIIQYKLTNEKEEEMRLLYVAMTRAREKLYIVSNIAKPENIRSRMKTICQFDKEYAILSAKSYMDWIFAALEYTDNRDCFVIEDQEIPTSDRLPSYENKGFVSSNEESAPQISASPELTETLKKRFEYKYPFEHISKLPAKLSVSSLSPRVLDEADNEVAKLDQIDDDFDSAFKKDFIIPESLHDKEKISAAEKGTATHAFLQFCDFERVASHGIENEVARLCDERFIAPKYAEIINQNQLAVFFKSSLYERISKAKRIWREQRFNIFLPASEFTRDARKAELLKDETIAVQGVIDIFFEDADGKIVLCDYKTDYLTKDELANPEIAAKSLNKKHADQLSYYAKAIAEMLGKAPDETIIYSLPLGGHIEVKM